MKGLKYSLFFIAAIFTSKHLNAQTSTRDNAGLQGDAGATSGFFETSNPVNIPRVPLHGGTYWM